LEYFLSAGDQFSGTVAALRADAGLEDTEDSKKGLLEKKWTAVVRLQKKVMDLEAKLVEAHNQKGGGGGGDKLSGSVFSLIPISDKKGLPREPAVGSMAGHRAPVTCVAMHPTYMMAASGSEDATIKLWDYETQQYERTLKGHTQSVTSVTFSCGGGLLASCSSDITAKIWDMGTYTCTKTLRGHDHTVSDVRFVSGDDQLVTCSRDNTVKIWECRTGYCLKTFSGHSDWVRCMSICGDEELLATGCNDATIKVWNLKTGTDTQTLRGHEHVVESVCFRLTTSGSTNDKNKTSSSLDSTNTIYHLASGARDKTVRLWDATNGVCLLSLVAHENWVRSVVLLPSGKHILSCSDDKGISVIDIKGERVMRNIKDAHAHFVTSLAVSPSTLTVITGSVDKVLRVWDVN